MKVVGVIPARWSSKRFEGKVLADIEGKPMIQHVWERSKKSKALNDVIIACDDERVLKKAQEFQANAVLTSANHPSGTDRVIEAVKDLDVDVVINIQGDEPLIQVELFDQLVNLFEDDAQCVMATVIKETHLESEINNPNVVKVTVDTEGNALYFSRSTIPFNRDQDDATYFKHLGIYAYRKEFLMKYADLPASQLEKTEKLEQLRVLEAGYKIKTLKTEYESVGVDTPEDLEKVKQLMKESKV